MDLDKSDEQKSAKNLGVARSDESCVSDPGSGQNREGVASKRSLNNGGGGGSSADMELDGDGPVVKMLRPAENPGCHYSLKILIPNHFAGCIIGKGGDVMDRLKETTGCRIKMGKSTDLFPSTTDRVCLLSGAPDSLRRAAGFIVRKLTAKQHGIADGGVAEAADDALSAVDDGAPTKVTFVVADSTAGLVIGKGGGSLRSMNRVDGLHVVVAPKKHSTEVFEERTITVNGRFCRVMEALQIVIEAVVFDPKSGTFPNVVYGSGSGGGGERSAIAGAGGTRSGPTGDSSNGVADNGAFGGGGHFGGAVGPDLNGWGSAAPPSLPPPSSSVGYNARGYFSGVPGLGFDGSAGQQQVYDPGFAARDLELGGGVGSNQEGFRLAFSPRGGCRDVLTTTMLESIRATVLEASRGNVLATSDVMAALTTLASRGMLEMVYVGPPPRASRWASGAVGTAAADFYGDGAGFQGNPRNGLFSSSGLQLFNDQQQQNMRMQQFAGARVSCPAPPSSSSSAVVESPSGAANHQDAACTDIELLLNDNQFMHFSSRGRSALDPVEKVTGAQVELVSKPAIFNQPPCNVLRVKGQLKAVGYAESVLKHKLAGVDKMMADLMSDL